VRQGPGAFVILRSLWGKRGAAGVVLKQASPLRPHGLSVCPPQTCCGKGYEQGTCGLCANRSKRCGSALDVAAPIRRSIWLRNRARAREYQGAERRPHRPIDRT